LRDQRAVVVELAPGDVHLRAGGFGLLHGLLHAQFELGGIDVADDLAGAHAVAFAGSEVEQFARDLGLDDGRTDGPHTAGERLCAGKVGHLGHDQISVAQVQRGHRG